MRTRKRITITLETHGAAFDDCEHGEIARIIRNVARSIADNTFDIDGSPRLHVLYDGTLLDTNGNTCGHVTVETIE